MTTQASKIIYTKTDDNRGSHFYLSLYWAQALAEQTQDTTPQARFANIPKQLADGEAKLWLSCSAHKASRSRWAGTIIPTTRRRRKRCAQAQP